MSTLPQLTGSEKQIAWAEKIRASYITVVGKTHSQSVKRDVAAHTDAKYWIDHRYGMGVTNAQQREIERLWK